MIRSHLRSLCLSASAAATLLCVAAPALAQEPNAPPPASTTAIPPPMQAMAAPKGTEDMTGSLGFGVGVTAGTSLIVPTANIALKYWLSDVLSVVPALNIQVLKPSGTGTSTSWNFNPEAVVLFVPFRSTSTRFSLGGGLGIGLGKPQPTVGNPNPNTAVHIYVPIQAGVEHFFTRWFSMGIAARSNLIDYDKDNAFSVSITTTSNNLAAVGQLFFYTD